MVKFTIAWGHALPGDANEETPPVADAGGVVVRIKKAWQQMGVACQASQKE